jgi:hypothetical protein
MWSLDGAVLVFWGISVIYSAFKFNGELLGIDDADIFFTYASNLASGLGISYSVGIPPVEGYTSTIWMLLSAFMFFLGFGEIGVFLLSIMFFLGTHFLAFRVLGRLVSGMNLVLAKFFYLLLLSVTFGYISWTTITLMDTTVWGFLIMAALYLISWPPQKMFSRILSVVVFASLATARPEAFMVVPVIIVVVFFVRRKWVTREVGLSIGVFLASAAAITLVRLSVFGYPLPNTFYAKVSPSLSYNLELGFNYLSGYLASTFSMILALSMLVFWVGFTLVSKIAHNGNSETESNLLDRSKTEILLSIFILVLGITPILSGGDHFNLFRVYQPYFPLSVLLIVLSWVKIKESKFGTRFLIGHVGTGVLIVVALVVSLSANSWVGVSKSGRSPIAGEFEISQNGRFNGTNINSMFSTLEELPSLGVIAAGGIARTYQGTIYDLMGLNNSQIAHGAGDRVGIKNHAAFEADVFYDLPVDILLVSSERSFAT